MYSFSQCWWTVVAVGCVFEHLFITAAGHTTRQAGSFQGLFKQIPLPLGENYTTWSSELERHATLHTPSQVLSCTIEHLAWSSVLAALHSEQGAKEAQQHTTSMKLRDKVKHKEGIGMGTWAHKVMALFYVLCKTQNSEVCITGPQSRRHGPGFPHTILSGWGKMPPLRCSNSSPRTPTSALPLSFPSHLFPAVGNCPLTNTMYHSTY